MEFDWQVRKGRGRGLWKFPGTVCWEAGVRGLADALVSWAAQGFFE